LRKTALTLVAMALVISSGVIASVPAASGSNLLAFIRDVNTSWGTPTSPTGAAPGDRDLPLTVTLQYLYPVSASSVEGLLTLPTGFTLYDGTNQTFTTDSAGVSTNSVFQITFGGIFLSPSLSLGSYNFSLNLWAYLQTSGGSTILPENLTVSVHVEGTPQLQFSTSTPSLLSGQVDDIPVLVTNGGSGNASQLSLSISAPGVSILSPLLEIPFLAAGNTTTVNVEAYVPSSASGSALSLSILATYEDPYGVQQSASQTVGFYVSAVPASQLFVQAGDYSLVPGTTNDVPITLTNVGTGPIFQVHTTVASPTQASVLTQFPAISELKSNASVTDSMEIYVSDSIANSPLELSFSITYVNGQGVPGSYTQNVGFYTTGSNSSLPGVVVSVSPIRNEVGAGTPSVVSFKVENVGTTSLGSPVLSLSVSSPLVVLQNSSYAVPNGILQSGESVTYESLVGSSTSASPGYYPVSVTITYLGQSGTEMSATFTSGLVLTGTIELVIQSPQVTQGNTTLSVSGEILNEGFSSAYYASVTGAMSGARATSQADYVGEIDPNTPVPFSLTLPYTPGRSALNAKILVNVAFKDSLGTTGTYNSTIQTTLAPVSTTGSSSSAGGSSSGVDLFTILELGVIAALIVMAVVGFIYIRRSRTKTSPSEYEEKEDKGVI
jgi:hypothetical protein